MANDPAAAYCNLEAERALLGSVLLDNESLKLALQTIDHSDFFSEANRYVFHLMCDLADSGRVIDLVTISEKIASNGNLEKVGGAGYLARLTDGVPVGASIAVSEYARIIREKADLRQLYNSTRNIVARIESGDSNPSALLEVARQQIQELEMRQRAAKAAALTSEQEKRLALQTATSATYPEVPKSAWYGASSLYLRAYENTTNASNNFHLATFLTIAGCLFGKDIFVMEAGDEFYPNLYTVLVGVSGRGRKDTAVNRGMKLQGTVDSSVTVIDTISSVEGFIDELAVEQKELVGKGFNGPLRILIRLRELRSLIAKAAQKGTSNIMPKLCELYDVPRVLKTPVRSKPARVEQPVGTIIAATSPEWLKDLEVRDLEAGLGSRVIWVPGDPKPRLKRRKPPDTDFLEPLKILIGQKLATCRRNAPVRFDFTGEAQKYFDEWAERVDIKRSGNELIDSLTARDEDTCRKVALIHAALSKAEDAMIELDHVQAATAFCDFLYEARFPIFSKHGISPLAEIDMKIRERAKRSMPLGVKWTDLRDSLWRIDHETFEHRMSVLMQGVEPPLRSTRQGRGRRVFSNEWEPEKASS